MRSCSLFWIGCFIECLTQTHAVSTSVSFGEKLFALEVKPLLAARCFACHGEDPEEDKGGLVLTSLEAVLAGGETSSKVLVPGSASASLMYQAVTWDLKDLQMPPKQNDRLSEKEVRVLRDWINEGAPWPDQDRVKSIREEFAEGVVLKTSGGLSGDWDERRYQNGNLWAYQPLSKPPVPSVNPGENPIDALLNVKIRETGLPPALPADRRTLIRRATFDLLGLPPSPEEVRVFLEDPRPDKEAFVDVVERLLASPHYGEQWGRHWLDVVRYADSSGYANDYQRGSAWRYRDYVIRAFNQDKPYDRFVKEQIAGDEWEPDDPEMLVAVGFLRMGPWELTGMEVAKVARQRFLDDVTDSIGQAFLSHPLQCARCHDHKFDPIPTRDYYRIQACFSTTQLVERAAPFLPEENTGGFDEIRYLQMRSERFKATLEALDRKEEEAARAWCRERGLDYVPRQDGLRKGLDEGRLPPRHVGLSPLDLGMERISRKGLERIRWELDRYEPVAFSVYNGVTPNVKSVNAPVRMPADRMSGGKLEEPAVLNGGDPFSPTQAVQPGALSLLRSIVPGFEGMDSFSDGLDGRRTELADWIAHPRNPLTSRSIVNRIWQWHFGRGLAGNPNNFGAMGKKPVQRELLDWLASEFIERGWSFKAMHRLIMLSDAYRRSSKPTNLAAWERVDPVNEWYGRFEPRRLTAEEIRDAMLFVSGELNPEMGGIPIRPEMNLEAALQPRMVMGTFAAAWQPSPLPEQRHRRAIYALKIRGLRDPFMEVFNEPGPEASCEAREQSTVTPQVFSLFNSRHSLDRALSFATRLLDLKGRREDTIDLAFAYAYGRSPGVEERELVLKHWKGMEGIHGEGNYPRREYPIEVVREAVEENTGVQFKFKETLDTYGEFVPDHDYSELRAETRALADVCLVLFNSNEFLTLD